MFAISFQGAIYVRTAPLPHAVEIYLPSSRVPHPSDTKPPREHHARIYIDDAVLEDSDGFDEQSYNGRKGVQFDLSGSPPLDGYGIRVGSEDRRPLAPYEAAIKRHMPVLSQCADRIFDDFDPAGSVAAKVSLTGGELRMKLTDRSLGRWVVDGVLGTSGPSFISRLAYDLEWCIEASDSQKELKIEVLAGADCVAWAKVGHRTRATDKVIIGNLDDKNGASWPTRPKTKCTGRVCPDPDFKWIYQLFDEASIDRELPHGGELPVPVLYRDPVTDDESGFDTPTCFPGTD